MIKIAAIAVARFTVTVGQLLFSIYCRLRGHHDHQRLEVRAFGARTYAGYQCSNCRLVTLSPRGSELLLKKDSGVLIDPETKDALKSIHAFQLWHPKTK